MKTESLNSMEGLEEPVTCNNNVMVKMPDGLSFRCCCGCNVFHVYSDKPNIYICNACDETYIGEK